MENYKDLKFQNEIGNSLILPIKDAGSIILEPNLGLPERLGKYELIYDYNAVPAPLFYNLASSSLNSTPPSMYNKGGSNANMIATSGIWSGIPTGETKQFVTYTVNPNAQVGVFSKGNIVNVIRFEGSNAIVENPNFVEAQATTTTTTSGWNWGNLFGAKVENTKELKVPKDYLSKVDDSTPITISTGINFGANLKPQPIAVTKPIYDTTLEQNATFVLTKDFDYVSGYVPSVCPPNEFCKQVMVAQYSVLKSGAKVSGRLFSKYIQGFSGGIASAYRPDTQQNVLKVEGYGSQGSIEIPMEYLTRPIVSVVSLVDKKKGKCNQTGVIQTTEYNPCRVSAVKGQTYNGYISGGSFYTTDGKTFLPNGEYKITEENNGTIIPVGNDNKNILMIIGAFLVGYVLFNKGKSE